MPDPAPLVVRAITQVIGGPLAVALRPTPATVRFGDDEGVARAIAIAGLALVPGLRDPAR